MKNFDGLSLNPILTKSLAQMKYDTPTPIQAKAIPLALDGRDIMGSAQTGTGKTAAFAIPLVEMLLNNTDSNALVLTPTRELGKQVLGIIHELLGKESGINTAFLIGGDSMQKQNNQLKRNPRLIVATPGRLNDHLERGNVDLSKTKFLVLDETDRMLDMGFSVQLDRIFKFMPKNRQSLMFSATLPKNIVEMSKKYLNNPERIAVGSTIEPAKNIKQVVVRVTDQEKYDELIKHLESRAGTIVMFVKTKYGTERMAKRLKSEGYDADALHGDLKQSRRDRVLNNFRDMKFQILVATDVAARGLDIPHIEHVINYDLPQVPEDFIHRIGRTARAGAEGEAISFVSPQDGRKWHAIEMLMDPTMKGSSMPNKGAAKPRGKMGGKFSGNKKPYGKSNDNRDDKPYAKKSFSKSKKGGDFAGKPMGKPYGKKPFEKSDDGDVSEGNFKKKNPFQRGQKNSTRSDDRSEGRKFEGRKEERSNNSEGGKKWGDKKPFNKSGKPAGKFGKSDKPFKKYEGSKDSRSDRSEKPDRSEGAKKSYGGFKGKSRSEGAPSFSNDRRDGEGFAKRKTSGKPGGFKGKSSGFKGNAAGANKGGKNFGGAKSFGGPNKARPATGGGKRPKGRVA